MNDREQEVWTRFAAAALETYLRRETGDDEDVDDAAWFADRMLEAWRARFGSAFATTADDWCARVDAALGEDYAKRIRVLHLVRDERRRARYEMADMCITLIESRRGLVLANKSDPSWTEHFAELINEVRALKADDGAVQP